MRKLELGELVLVSGGCGATGSNGSKATKIKASKVKASKLKASKAKGSKAGCVPLPPCCC
ncbi:hypothetical protein [uncultured Zoogloea sp.]|uniref:hypothetical protein n=1 Tax=uncultured Zoogloea sp. TaxID=160237 RepID=UPI00261F44AC|nr:hypothetical protein [uncultured Zoogloea sp.]